MPHNLEILTVQPGTIWSEHSFLALVFQTVKLGEVSLRSLEFHKNRGFCGDSLKPSTMNHRFPDHMICHWRHSAAWTVGIERDGSEGRDPLRSANSEHGGVRIRISHIAAVSLIGVPYNKWIPENMR